MRKTIAIAACALVLAGCAGKHRMEDVAGAIDGQSLQFETLFNAGDSAGLAALYTADAAVMPPDAARIDGREGIQRLWQGFFDAGISDLDLTTVELIPGHRTASEVGNLTLTAPDGQGGRVTVSAKYIVLWQKGEDGVWRLHRDIWNGTPG